MNTTSPATGATPSPAASSTTCARASSRSRKRPATCTTWKPRRPKARPTASRARTGSAFPASCRPARAEMPYYTNSSQLPVGFTDDPFEALERQDELQRKYTGGTVLHLYMSERMTSAEACKKLVRRALERFRLPYITVTPTFSICPKHGYLAGEHEFCPRCDEDLLAKKRREAEACVHTHTQRRKCHECSHGSPGLTQIELRDDERQRCEVWTRVMGYHRPVASFNTGKKGEHSRTQVLHRVPRRPALTRRDAARRRADAAFGDRLPGRAGREWCIARAAPGAAAIATTRTCCRPTRPAGIAWSEVLGLPARRRGLLDAVVFSGGEPTAAAGAGAAMRDVRSPRLSHRPAQRGHLSAPLRRGAAPGRLGRLRRQGAVRRGLRAHHRRARERRAALESARLLLASGVDCEFAPRGTRLPRCGGAGAADRHAGRTGRAPLCAAGISRRRLPGRRTGVRRHGSRSLLPEAMAPASRILLRADQGGRARSGRIV